MLHVADGTERLHPPGAHQLGCLPAGEREDVVADRTTGLQRRRDAADELLVVVDHLLVVDLDPGATDERVEGRAPPAPTGDVDVLRPVGPHQGAGPRAGARCGRRGASGA
jgi:hypothetical protein